jgi:hypothetical protein
MRIRFHKIDRPSREVGVGSIRERCHSEPAPWGFRKSSALSPDSTVLAVNLDLGQNNALFIRGEGGGLRWDKGQLLTYIDPKTWVWSTRSANDKLEFQFLLNDEVWEKGEAHILQPSTSIELTPDFEWPEIPRVS